MSLFVLRRNSIPVAVWVGSRIMEPSTICGTDNAAIECSTSFSPKQAGAKCSIEKSEKSYWKFLIFRVNELENIKFLKEAVLRRFHQVGTY